MKQILLPTDFSDNAFNAILTAIKMQQKEPANFTLLHVYKPDTTNGEKVSDASYIEAINKLEETLATIDKVLDNTKHNFFIIAKPGDLATTIKELIITKDLDLITIGTKGATDAKHVIFGSNTVKVIKSILNCPVLVVPSKYNLQSLHKVVFPTEYAHFFSKGQLNSLIELIKTWRAQIMVLHVAQEFKLSEKQLANKKILKERFSDIHPLFYKVTIKSTVANAITEFTKEQAAEMICLVQYRHTFMEKLTQEPVVKKVGFNAEVPLLILPD